MTRRFVFRLCAVLFCFTAATVHADSLLSRLNPWKTKPWMPLEEGRTWHYDTSEYTSDGAIHDKGITTAVVDTLITFDKYNDMRTFATVIFSSPILLPVRCRYSFHAEEPDVLYGDKGEVLYDFTAVPGNMQKLRSETRETGLYAYQSITTMTYLGCGDVTVPAGRFRNCRKYRRDSLMCYTENHETEIRYQRAETIWFSRGAGMVMIDCITKRDGGGEERTVLALKNTGSKR